MAASTKAAAAKTAKTTTIQKVERKEKTARSTV
jgi:hypothetical protein